MSLEIVCHTAALTVIVLVAAHFGRLVAQPDGTRRVERGPDYDQLEAYFHVDWGPGRIRGICLQGNLAIESIFRAWLAPFADLGSSTLSPSGNGATDHMSFDRIGRSRHLQRSANRRAERVHDCGMPRVGVS